jgi:hypothetical protein
MRRQDGRGTAVGELGGLEGVRVRLEGWRQQHKPPTPIPEELWSEAVDLARRHGLAQTAKTLRLDYAALKRRLRDGGHQIRPVSVAPAPAEFIELLSPVSTGIGECALEVESTQGARMRVVMKNLAPQGLACILREFVVG